MKPVDYSAVDWAKHDAAIARDLGVSRAAVMNARRRAGAPPSKKPVKLKLSRAEWKGRAAILMDMLCKWEEMAGDDLGPEMDQVAVIFAEARFLKQTA